MVDDVQLTAFFYAIGAPYQDTLVIHDTIYVEVLVHDTVTITDTLVLMVTDTLTLHDTIYLPQYIHDTIYIGIDDVVVTNAKIYLSNGQVVVEGSEGYQVTLYDVNGRTLATKQDDNAPLLFDVPVSGTYMIRIGNYPARKVVVIR